MLFWQGFAREHMSGGRKRWAVINAWRHASPGEERLRATPLALLDDSTVAWGSDEVMYYPITLNGQVAFNYTLQHSDAHRWYRGERSYACSLHLAPIEASSLPCPN